MKRVKPLIGVSKKILSFSALLLSKWSFIIANLYLSSFANLKNKAFLSANGIFRHALIALFYLFFFFYPTVISAFASHSALYGIPEVFYFNRRNYSGGTQNWKLSQAANGLMYFANNDGILEFDGIDWRLLPKSADVIHRSVLAWNQRIYMGAFNEFGYYETNHKNDFVYHSLSSTDDYKSVGDVWNIVVFNGNIVFQADKGLVVYNEEDGTLSWIPARSRISNAFLVNGLLLIYDEMAGLMELRNDSLYEVPGGARFAGKSIGAILSLSPTEFLIATISDGLYFWDQKDFTSWQAPVADFLAKMNVFCGVEYRENQLVFGTIQSGVVVTDKSGNLMTMVNKDRGLNNNTVLGLTIDQEGNIWAGLDNGVARINYNSTINFIQGYYDIGTGYAASVGKESVYLGTNQGLYHIKREMFDNPVKDRTSFHRLEKTNGQVWSLFSVNEGQLLCGHNNGVFEIVGEQVRQITPPSVMGGWIFRYPPGREDLLLVGTYNGLILLKNENERWTYYKSLTGFNESARFMEWEGDRLWITHGYRGVFRLQFSEDYETIEAVESFENAPGLPSGLALNVSKVNEGVIFSSERGVFGYDNNSESFYRHYLNHYFTVDSFPVLVHQDRFLNYWFFTSRDVGVLRKLDDGTYKKVTSPFYPVEGKLVNGFEYLNVLDEQNVLIGIEDGFAHYAVNDTKAFMQPFNVHIRGLRNLSDPEVVYYHSTETLDTIPEWPFSHNSFEVHYSATCFESTRMLYSSYFEGFDEGWTNYSYSTQRQLTNIPNGEYIFWVKARNIHGVESQPVGFKFVVLPPWYRTITARVIYGVVVLLLLVFAWYLLNWLISRSRAMELQKQQEKFRITEEHLRNDALEKEKEMIRLRNEKLRNEMVFKEKELANSTINVIQKNDFLLNIKDDLLRIYRHGNLKEIQYKVSEIVRKIDRDIDNESQWELFEIHLEQVHQDFLNRLRKQFSDLTLRETRLCAYLRMEMSSKEISSLMNISVRAVENNRYKLRKKLGLEGKDNLNEFIRNI
ncbi:regulator [Geofilum sp. OHC36d9]|uniref:regulator n=1 Tax=Geofilum sp. OHC36d9 TaxID=3458413 RepID=UPI0040334064